MAAPPPVEPISATATHDLRREVLRGGRADALLAFPGDEAPSTVHLGIRGAGGTLVAVATLLVEPYDPEPGRPALRLRGMAVAEEHRGQGLGRRLLDAVIEEAGRQGAELLWAAARDTALPFYTGAGFRVVGEGYVTADTGVAHHTVTRALDRTG